MNARIREAGPKDLDGIAASLGRRAGLNFPWPDTRRELFDLDPERLCAWIAVDAADRVLGLSCVERHPLQVDDAILDAGYWTHFHVDPPLREQLSTPLIEATLSCGQAPIYRVCQDEAEARTLLGHGLVELGRLCLRVMSLRPLTLAAKRLQLPSLATRATEPLDRVAGTALQRPGWRARKRPRGVSVVELTLPEDGEAIVELIAGARSGLVTRRWSPRSLEAHYDPTPETSPPCTILGLLHAGEIVGVAAYRITDHNHRLNLSLSLRGDLRAVELLELVARGDEPELLADLLAAIEHRATNAGAEAVLVLDALGPAVSTLLDDAGYRDEPPARVLIAGPSQVIAATPGLRDVERWRLALSAPCRAFASGRSEV